MKNRCQSNDEYGEGMYLQIFFLIKMHKWTWQSIGAIIGLGGGIVSIVIAILLPAVPLIKGISSVFLMLFLLLLGLGAHCLDLLEEKSNDYSVKDPGN